MFFFFVLFLNNVPKCHLKWNNNFVARGTVQLSVILYFVVFFFFSNLRRDFFQCFLTKVKLNAPSNLPVPSIAIACHDHRDF